MTRPSARDVVEGAIARNLLTGDHQAVAAAATEILRNLSQHMGRSHVHPFGEFISSATADGLRRMFNAEGWDAASRYLREAADDTASHYWSEQLREAADAASSRYLREAADAASSRYLREAADVAASRYLREATDG